MDLSQIEMVVRDFWKQSPLNTLAELNGLQIFSEPLFGVAAADDPIFAEFLQEDVVGRQHFLPGQWLADSRAVLSYFLPFSREVREANRGMGQPAREWLYGRIEGELFNKALSAFLADWFHKQGHAALVPATDARLQVVHRRSNWSERHVAYAAGLGTFGLSCSFITRQGSAGRLGSVVVTAPLTPTPRYYSRKDENCNQCGACIRRCPPLAITEQGKDHEVCAGYLDRVLARFQPRYGCGKCQTAVPCEAQIPVR